jgi:hypothetical protein
VIGKVVLPDKISCPRKFDRRYFSRVKGETVTVTLERFQQSGDSLRCARRRLDWAKPGRRCAWARSSTPLPASHNSAFQTRRQPKCFGSVSLQGSSTDPADRPARKLASPLHQLRQRRNRGARSLSSRDATPGKSAAQSRGSLIGLSLECLLRRAGNKRTIQRVALNGSLSNELRNVWPILGVGSDDSQMNH